MISIRLDGYRDTDWFTAVLGASGTLVIALLAEQGTDFLELGPQECETVGVLVAANAQSCQEIEMTVTGDPGNTV